MRTVATAGHVDHGKSSLVLALTGTDPDRFPEEKARGLTIDLGFAFTTLPSGVEVGFVDVPGHVRFIKNMLAGVGAVDVAVLVVAATEGWMPQSEEHLRILELLDVRHGLVAVTKADLVDDETLEIAQLEVSERLGRSSLASAPLVACDSLSGRGLDDVRAELDAVLARAPAARDRGRPRVWIDRVFAARGAGTVVTGTLTGGTLRVDDEVDVGPRPRQARVRAIESAHRHVEAIGPGNRVALNLSGVDHHELARGDAVVRPGQWTPTTVVDVALTPASAEPARRHGRFQAYVGSGEHAVTVRALDPDARFARLRFAAPLPLGPGDRIVLRDPGRRETFAGAEVLDIAPRGRARDAAARLGLPLGERLAAGNPWLQTADLARLGALSESEAQTLADDLLARGIVVACGDWLTTPAEIARVRSAAHTRVRAAHREQPTKPGLELSTLAAEVQVEPAQVRAALAGVPDLVVERGAVRHTSHQGRVADTDEARALVAALDAAPFAPPDPADLGVPVAVVRALVREGVLADLDGVVFSTAALERVRTLVIDALRVRGSMTVADVRDLLGSSRKYVLPIVGWLDRTGVTRRRGDDRVPGPTSGLL